MIRYLSVRNLAGVREASLRFSSSLVAITGESGAGKSTLLKAISLCLGERGGSRLLQDPSRPAEVEMELHLESPIRVRRVIQPGGRNRAFLDGEEVSLRELQRRTSGLLEVESQFYQLVLKDPLFQLEILDLFGGEPLRSLKGELSSLYDRVLLGIREMRRLEERRRELSREVELMRPYVPLLREGSLFDATSSLPQRVLGLERRVELLSLLGEVASAAEEGLGLGAMSGLLRRALDLADEPRIKERVERALEAVERASRDVGELLEYVDLEEIGGLRVELERLRRLLRQSQEALRAMSLRSPSELRERLSLFEGLEREMGAVEEALVELRREVEEGKRALRELALKLSEARREASSALCGEVGALLLDLGMEGASLEVSLRGKDRISRVGLDEAELLFRPRAEALPLPLARFASGGEMSRVYLALKVALASRGLVPSAMVFDEVESGLGGRSARLLGRMLRRLSSFCQVVVVTHEATIAAMADEHFVVRREGEEASVERVEGEERAREIARMLSGEVDEVSLGHARSILSSAGVDSP